MWTWRKKTSEEARHIEALRASLVTPPSNLPLTQLLPIFVPSSFFALGNWPGPYELSRIEQLGLTWAFFLPSHAMRYLDGGVRAWLELRKVDWKKQARDNADRLAEASPWTHEFRDENGAIYAVAMMHEDGAGPTRLLAERHLHQQFPNGYLVALPEMSCGIAISTTASPADTAKIAKLVEDCFESGTRPLVAGLHDGALLR